jgi:hypothetical protein
MAKRPTSHAVGKVRRTKKEKPSVNKVSAVAAKPAAARSGAKAKGTPSEALRARSAEKSKHTKKERASVEEKVAGTKPAVRRSDAEAKGTPPVVHRVKSSAAAKLKAAKAAVSRPGGKAKRTPPMVQRAKTHAADKLKRKKVEPMPLYLAAELGQPVDQEGEPIGAGSARLQSDTDLQDYSLRLWRQMQSGGVVNRYMRAIERAGLTIDEIWTAGITDIRSTSSTPDELRRYQQKLLFRANLLEAILSETVADLHRLPGIEPTPSDTVS